ncbi:MAG TPA: sigma-70 family RNA polymerase sigma factor [Gaiellaceae bacterium]|jgi:RNA polymerase sigma-70 factor (ECF subfamily)
MAQAPPSDATLATRASAGDAEALAGLLERYRPSLYAAAIGLLRDREEAHDAVQEACVVALVRIGSLRDPAAVGGWLHRVLRNVCLMNLRSRKRTTPHADIGGPELARSVDEAVERLTLRDWVWTAIEELTPEERITVMLRHFTRSSSYEAIAALTGVPVGTVRSRLYRARTQLATALHCEAADSLFARSQLERETRAEWEGFYEELHETPTARTYRLAYAPDVQVTDRNGSWHGVGDWSSHEREAIVLGVRAHIVDLVASRDITVIEIDFTNPDWASDHCPPRSTFVHRLAEGRSRRLDIHYV